MCSSVLGCCTIEKQLGMADTRRGGTQWELGILSASANTQSGRMPNLWPTNDRYRTNLFPSITPWDWNSFFPPPCTLCILQLSPEKLQKRWKILKYIWYRCIIWRHSALCCPKAILFFVPSFFLSSSKNVRIKCRTKTEGNISLVSMSILFGLCHLCILLSCAQAVLVHFAKAAHAIESLSLRCLTTVIKLSSLGAFCYFETQESIVTYPHNIYTLKATLKGEHVLICK